MSRAKPSTPSAPKGAAVVDATKERLLTAALVTLGRHGPNKLTLSDVAKEAGVSRPTVYRHFASKEDLLVAVAAREQRRFDEGMAAAISGLEGRERLDAALEFVVKSQAALPMGRLVDIEPTFVLSYLTATLPDIRAALTPLVIHVRKVAPSDQDHQAKPKDVADVLARVVLSHVLFPPSDHRAFLREELQAISHL